MHRRKHTWVGLLVSIALLAALVIFTILHFSDAQQFARMIQRARPEWLALALVLQFATYVCVGGVWRVVLHDAGHRLRVLQLARLAIEKLTVDQIMPSGGASGDLVVTAALRRLDVPATIAVEALIINTMTRYVAYALVTAIVFVLLWAQHELTRVLASLLAVFLLIAASVPAGIAWLLRHRDWKPGPRLGRFRLVRSALETIASVSPERIRELRLLGPAFAFNFAIFVLDGGTLWTMLRAIASPVPFSTAFAALVVGSIAGTVSFLPGGIGSFEAACTLALRSMGVPMQAALTGTLLLRGLTLWLPLIPGGILARRDLS